jgi:uncharacterized protein
MLGLLKLRSALLVCLPAVSLATACRDTSNAPSSSGPDAGSFDKPALLGAFASCAVGRYQTFLEKAQALRAQADSASPEKIGDVQNAWKATMEAWQQTEALTFGPLAMNSSPGGQELRAGIYAWPLASRCAIEQGLVQKQYEDPNFAIVSFANTRGLGALEYLVFYTGSDNACPADNPINKPGASAWSNLDSTEIAARKRAYAKVVAQDLEKRAQTLVLEWSSSGKNFTNEFTTAGRGSRIYTREQMAFNAVSDAVTLLSLDLKNMKVGKPAGIVSCTTASCPDAIEHPIAKTSIQSVRANLQSLRAVLVGCSADAQALGFDDLLRAVGAGDFAAKLVAHLVDAETKAAAVSSLEDAVASNPASLRAIYDALKLLEIDLKTDFVTILNLELPKIVEGDND